MLQIYAKDGSNPGKRSFGVNLKTKEGQDLVRELIKEADVLVRVYLHFFTRRYADQHGSDGKLRPWQA